MEAESQVRNIRRGEKRRSRGREKTNKNKNKTSAQEQTQAGPHTLPGCKREKGPFVLPGG